MSGGGRPVLGRRALNRALLARQLLLRRAELDPIAAIEHLIGLQAQAPLPPYFGLWTRLRAFRPTTLAALLEQRRVVRLALLRGTVHLVSAADCLRLRGLLQPMLERPLHAGSPYVAALAGLELDAIAAAATALLAVPRTASELGRLLQVRWPDRDPGALSFVARARLPLVQLPPRAVWGAQGVAGRAVLTPAERWLGSPLDPSTSLDELVLRYLNAFGPATVQDMQAWSGLTRLGAVVERLRDRLLTFADEQGRLLFDLPEAPRPDPDTPAPVRLLPAYDNLLLSHADRSRVISDAHRKVMITINGIVKGSLLVDGFVRGSWDLIRRAGELRLIVEPLAALSRARHRAARRRGQAPAPVCRGSR